MPIDFAASSIYSGESAPHGNRLLVFAYNQMLSRCRQVILDLALRVDIRFFRVNPVFGFRLWIKFIA